MTERRTWTETQLSPTLCGSYERIQKPGDITVMVQAPGYASRTENISIEELGTTELDVALCPDSDNTVPNCVVGIRIRKILSKRIPTETAKEMSVNKNRKPEDEADVLSFQLLNS